MCNYSRNYPSISVSSSIIVITLTWIGAIKSQSLKPDKILVIESGSKNDTISLSQRAGFQIQVLYPGEFSNGGTRKRAVLRNQKHEFVVFHTGCNSCG